MILPSKKLKVYLMGNFKLYYKGVTIQIPAIAEQWLVYQSFVQYDSSEVIKFFKGVYPDFSIIDLQELFVRVQRAHPYVSLGENDSMDIPAYSPRGGVWEMYSPLHKKLEITWNFERFLLASFKTGNIHDIETVAHYFKEYREKWDINTRYKKDQKDQDMKLAYWFLIQHGLNERLIKKKKEPNPFEYKEPKTVKENLDVLIGFAILAIGWGVPAYLISLVGDFFLSFNTFWGCIAALLCLIIGLSLPILPLIFKK